MIENRDAFAILEEEKRLTDDDIQLIVANIKKYHGLEKAQQLATRYTNKALQDIDKLPAIPEKDILKAITTKLLQRHN